MSARAERGGFTLVEILAALTILASALFILLDAHYAALSLHEQTDEELALRQMLMLTAGRAEVEVLQGTLTDSGDFGMRFPGYSWSFEAVASGGDDESKTNSSFSNSITPMDLIPLYDVTATVTTPDDSHSLNFFVINSGVPQEENANRMFKNTRMFSK